ncbi:hypothetical protein ACP4OV_009005 [Aristida adscensionis]
MFSRNIGIDMTSFECLQYVDIADNRISGSLPVHLFNLTAMRHASRSSFCLPPMGGYDHGFILSTKGQELNYGSFNRFFNLNMTNIDLSSNYFTGEIPEELATFDALMNLNLSRNLFSGNIPEKIGTMQSLESLDLSRNKLSGEIPASLSNLTFISFLDLSYNKLTGRIPSGSQLDTLYSENPSMYTGNIGLCGPPLQTNCLSTDTSRKDQSRRTDGDVPEFFYLGLGCGFIAGIWVVFCTLLFKKRWRIAYFCLFDRLNDQALVIAVVSWVKLTQKITSNN